MILGTKPGAVSLTETQACLGAQKEVAPVPTIKGLGNTFKGLSLLFKPKFILSGFLAPISTMEKWPQ
jgi:hypothetical protein